MIAYTNFIQKGDMGDDREMVYFILIEGWLGLAGFVDI